MSVAVLRFLGTNCEFDVCYALEKLNAPCKLVWFKEDSLPQDTSLVVIPGGFSYGDYLRSGAIARFAPIMKAVVDFAKKGGRVLGICNGFQILVESGLLPGALMPNRDRNFIGKSVALSVVSNNNALLSSYTKNSHIILPIAHAEGCYFADSDTLKQLQDRDQILLSYVENINGSTEAIAGICNAEKTIFGLMPHPERAIQKELGSIDGVDMLRNILC